MNKKKILVFAYTHLNLGDDLFLKILFERFLHSQFTIIGDKSKYNEVFKNYPISYISFPNYFKNKYLRRVFAKYFKTQNFKCQFAKKKKFLLTIESEFDAVVTIGGSIFIQNNIQNSFNFSNQKLILDVFRDKPKFIIGSNFGPYETASYLKFFTNTFAKYTDVCFRDEYSRAIFNNLKNVRCHPDVVFSGNFSKNEKIENRVGISVMDFSSRKKLSLYQENYQKLIVNIIKSNIDKNCVPYLFSFCEYEGDERAINRIIEMLDEKYSSKVIKVFYDGNIDVFLESFSTMETMYSSRFHAMILSMIYEQKIHPIIYSKKMTDVLVDMDYTGKYTDLKSLNEEVNNDILDMKHYVLDHQIKYDADKQFEALEKFVNS